VIFCNDSIGKFLCILFKKRVTSNRQNMEFRVAGVMDLELQYLKIEYTNSELSMDNLRDVL
jgi:hypothetical protein